MEISYLCKMYPVLTTRRIHIFLVLIIAILLGITVLNKYADTYKQLEVMFKSSADGHGILQQASSDVEKPQERVAFTSEPWVSRMDALRRGCTTGLNGYQLTSKQVTQRYFSSSRAGFSVCKVPKAGSSFWTIVFIILQKQKAPEEAFLIPRGKLHGMGHFSSRPPIDSALNIVVSRDPYARLYSGFIDKIFLAGWKMKGKGNLKYLVKDLVCGYNTTFADFLDIITKTAFRGAGINRHWAPVYLLCNACSISYQAVSHTETLTSDTEYIVDNLQVSDSERVSLKQIFHRKEMNMTLRGLLADLLHPSKSLKKRCPDRLAYLYKLWQSLQIQGYLHTQSTFPWDFFENKDNLDERFILNLILETIERRPLSSQEKKLQRRAALVSAYKTVQEETIRRIQQMFMMDFRLFGYDINPPS